MAHEPLRMGDLRGLSPRKLWDLAAERGIEVPDQATSADVRQALVGGGGTVTTADVPTRGAGVTAGEAAGVAGGPSPLLSAAFAQLDESDHEEVAGAIAEAVLDQLTVDQLKSLAGDHGVEVERQDGDGDPLHSDYVDALAVAVIEGTDTTPAPAASEPTTAEAATPPGPTADEPAAPATEPATPASSDGLEDEGVTVKDLRGLAKDNSVEVASRATKADLVTALRDAGVRREG